MAIYKIKNVGAGKCLNIAGSNLLGTSLYDNQNVTLWSDSGSGEQMWILPKTSGDMVIRSYLRRTMGLNAYRSSSTKYNCDLHKIEGNETDATVTLETVSNGVKIKLKNYNMYLTVDSSTDGTSVYWSAKSSSSYQVWKLEEINVIEDGTSATIYAIVGTLTDASLNDSQRKTNATYIKNFLSGKGFSKNAIYAMLGNFQAESSLNPAIWQYRDSLTNGGYGLAQWTTAPYFLNWAVDVGLITSATASAINSIANTKKQKLMDAELSFLMWTLQMSGDYFTSTSWPFSKFKTSSDTVKSLTKVFFENYEQAGDDSLSTRQTYAANWETYFS